MSEPIDPGVIALAAKVFDLAREGDTDQLVDYLEAGVPANLTNDKGDTLLILAAYRGHTRTVEALLAWDADHSRANDRGQTPLAAAVFKQSADDGAGAGGRRRRPRRRLAQRPGDRAVLPAPGDGGAARGLNVSRPGEPDEQRAGDDGAPAVQAVGAGERGAAGSRAGSTAVSTASATQVPTPISPIAV